MDDIVTPNIAIIIINVKIYSNTQYVILMFSFLITTILYDVVFLFFLNIQLIQIFSYWTVCKTF